MNNTPESKKSRTTLTPLGKRVLGGLAASAVVIGLGIPFGNDITHGAKVTAERIIDGGTSPTQHQLDAEPQSEVVVKSGDTIWSMVNKVDPTVNAPTNEAIVQFVINENHGSAILSPGQQLGVPIVDAKTPNSPNNR